MWLSDSMSSPSPASALVLEADRSGIDRYAGVQAGGADAFDHVSGLFASPTVAGRTCDVHELATPFVARSGFQAIDAQGGDHDGGVLALRDHVVESSDVLGDL